MIDKLIATNSGHGTTFYHKTEKNRNGTPVRCRVTGVCKVWVTRPEDYKLPVMYGMRNSFYITPRNANEWTNVEPKD